MIIKLIIAAIVFMSLTQKKSNDRGAAIIFCVPLLALSVVENSIHGWYYYSAACILASITISVLLFLFKTKLSMALSSSLLASMVINLFGFNMWFFEQAPDLYYYSFILYYIFVLYLLFAKGSSMWIAYWRGSLQFLGSLRLLFGRILG